MSKLKDKLIRLLGGLTEADFIVRSRPVRVGIQHFSMETLSVCQIVNTDILQAYPEYMDYVHNEMMYKIADEMMEKKLVEFKSKQESPDQILVRATARIFRPEVKV